MQIRKLKPVTPGQRHQVVFSKNSLSKNNLMLKGLVRDFKQKKRSLFEFWFNNSTSYWWGMQKSLSDGKFW
jgi:ribosomal protein L2